MIALLLTGCATARQPSLSQRIDRVVTSPELVHAVWGIEVEDDAGRVLYQRNAGSLLQPASTRKIFAAASVLNCLGPEYRYATELWLDGRNLVLRGAGDPSLGGRWAYDRDAVFTPFVAALKTRGITSVDSIIADVSAFDRVTIPGTWKVGNLGSDYAAPVDALAYNENVVGVWIEHCGYPVVTTDPMFLDSVESVTCGAGEPSAAVNLVSDENVVKVTGTMAKKFFDLPAIAGPGLYAAQALRDALRHAGIAVESLRLNTKPQPWGEYLATIESQPLWQLLTVVLKNSQNLYAEMMLKSTAGTYRGAFSLERQFLEHEIGIDPEQFRFVDGSGLSPDDLVTPAAIVQMFRWMNAPARRGLYWTILATPGEDGTLRKRLIPLGPRLRGKTGTIAGVNALSGIVRGTSGGHRYFSVVINHHIADGTFGSKSVDEIVSAIADF